MFDKVKHGNLILVASERWFVDHGLGLQVDTLYRCFSRISATPTDIPTHDSSCTGLSAEAARHLRWTDVQVAIDLNGKVIVDEFESIDLESVGVGIGTDEAERGI